MYSYKKEVAIEKEKIRRMINWYNGIPSPPFKIDAELHRRCNLKCLPCSRKGCNFDMNKDSKKKELPVETWLRIVKEAAELGVLIWNIEGGGEPLANKKLTLPVMGFVKKQNLYGIITTNGTLWNENDVKKLVDIKWDRIHFSIDGPDAETHDYLRGIKGCFKKTIETIELMNKLKEKYSCEEPMLSINVIINNKNYKKLPQFVDFCHELKAEYIFVEPLIIFSKLGENLKLNEHESEELQTHIREAKKLAQKHGIDNNFSTKDENLKKDLVNNTSKMKHILLDDIKEIEDPFLSAPCDKPWNNLAIKYNGLTGHCGLLLKGENIRKKTLKGVWYGPFLKKMRHKMLNKELLEHCSRCVPSDVTQRRRLREELKKMLQNG